MKLKTLYQRWHKALWPAAATQVARDADYARRIASETDFFSEMTEVHELPQIFHYWSGKYLGTPKLHPFGITDPEHFFVVYIQKFHARFPERHIRAVSIGCGN